jgi:hypothetical protein
MRLFLVDVVSITKANCAQKMNYYESLMLVLIGLKLALVLLLLGPWLLQRLLHSASCCLGSRLRSRVIQVQAILCTDRVHADTAAHLCLPPPSSYLSALLGSAEIVAVRVHVYVCVL